MATLEQIAAEAGVSRGTVSNVLNGRIKENWSSTARRADEIREIAQRMGYRPNTAARAVATGKFNTVGLLLSSEASRGAIFDSTWRSIEELAREQDLHVLVGTASDEELTSEKYLPKLLRDWAVDGLIINYISDIPSCMVELIARYRIPAVWLNVRMKADCIYPDDYDAAVRATHHLIDLGHREVAYAEFIASPHYSMEDRQRGYRDTMKATGLKPVVWDKAQKNDITGWQQVSMELLRQKSRPSAVLAYEEDRAMPLYCAALRLGLDVPRDLSLMTFHQARVSGVGEVINTMQIPAREIGEKALEMLQKKIADPEKALPPLALPFEMRDGQTCAPPAGVQ